MSSGAYRRLYRRCRLPGAPPCRSPVANTPSALARTGFVAQEHPLYWRFSVADLLRMGRAMVLDEPLASPASSKPSTATGTPRCWYVTTARHRPRAGFAHDGVGACLIQRTTTCAAVIERFRTAFGGVQTLLLMFIRFALVAWR